MAQVINEMDVPSHSFVFHGTGERYFLICVVNVLLTIGVEFYSKAQLGQTLLEHHYLDIWIIC